MIEPPSPKLSSEPAGICAEFEDCVRQHPGTAVLLAVAAGLVAAALIVGHRPQPTAQQRLLHLLHDLEDDLRRVTSPALKKGQAIMSQSAGRAAEGTRAGATWLERFSRQARQRIQELAP